MHPTPVKNPSSPPVGIKPQPPADQIPPPRELHEDRRAGGNWATRFQLDSLMLTIGLVAVCLAVARQSIVLGGLLFLFSAPAYFRTAKEAAWRASFLDSMRPLDKITSFLDAFFAALVCGVMTATVFFAMSCATLALSVGIGGLTGASSSLTVLCVLLGMLATLGVTCFFAACLVREFWQFDGAPPGKPLFSWRRARTVLTRIPH